jgi:hypothetical protein
MLRMATKKDATPTSNAIADDLRMLRLEEVAARMGWSVRSLERLCADG